MLPKFSKVIETRKTTEAEELMAAVRIEQEKRCALDKDYISDLSKLSDIVPSKKTKNFVYNASTTSIEAQSKGKYGYTLKMPSYRDGRLCCENEEECLKLNKDYPLCSELIARADYQSGEECAGQSLSIACVGSSTQSCGCQNKGTQTRTCDTTTGRWSSWSTCSAPLICSCTAEKPATTQRCNFCGTQTRSVSCDSATGEWSVGAWSACDKVASDCFNLVCAEGTIQNTNTDCGKCGVIQRQCVKGDWVESCVNETGVCTPGTFATEGGSRCSSGGFAQPGSGLVVSRPVTGGMEVVGSGSSSNLKDPSLSSGGTTTTQPVLASYSGRYCNDQCSWEILPCKNTGGSSGGGASGCSSKTREFTNMDANSNFQRCTVIEQTCIFQQLIA